MLDWDTWQEVFSTLQKNPLRTLMTAWGIFWGTFMLVVMLGFGSGLRDGVTKNLLGSVGNNVYLWGRHTTLPYAGHPPGRRLRFSVRDKEALQRATDAVEAVAPTVQLGGWRDGVNVARGPKTGNFGVKGEYPAFARLAGFRPYSGRFINERDLRQRRKVAVLGEQVRKILFADGEDPLGQYLKVRGVQFQVVGVFHDQQTPNGAERNNNTVYVPFSSFQSAFNHDDRVGAFGVLLRPDADPGESEAALRRALARRHGVHPDDTPAIGSYNHSEKVARIRTLFRGTRAFVWAVCLATLLAGALGVSNIMLISVKERTREFGLRKALGATPGSILRLVLQEATVLTTLAGYLGLVCGVGSLHLAHQVLESRGGKGPLGEPSIDIGVALLATALLALCGAIAGLAPARHAAKIHPIVALRSQ